MGSAKDGYMVAQRLSPLDEAQVSRLSPGVCYRLTDYYLLPPLHPDKYVIIRGMICLDYCYSILLSSYSKSSDALGNPDLLLSYSMIALALHNTIILIITIP